MQDDERIKMLLHEYGVEEVSSTFNNNVMQRINVTVFAKHTKPLLNAFILNLLKIIFLIVLVALIICFAFVPINNFPYFSISLGNEVYRQIFTFIIVFWIVMLMNMWLNKKWSSKSVFI